MYLLAIDPGGVHCGVAEFEFTSRKTARCVKAYEINPERLFDLLETSLTYDKVVYESFSLFPWKSKEQGFSQLEVVQTIGVIKYLCGPRNFEDGYLVSQAPTIKVPTLARAKARGYKFVSVRDKTGGHAKDAELHGICWLEQNGYTVTIKETK